jgi:DnaD/phage-associated family protein
MGRPLKDGLDYFPHDCDMRDDPRLKMMRTLFGNDGYAFYCVLLEIIYAQPKCTLILTPQMEAYVIKEIRVSPRKFREMLAAATSKDVQLFDGFSWESQKSITSRSIQERAKLALRHREEMRIKRGLVSAAQIPLQIPPETDSQRGESTLPYSTLPESNLKGEGILPTPTPSSDELVGSALASFTLISKNLQGINNGDRIEAEAACRKYSPEWVKAAVQEACSQNKMTWRYTSAILRRWERERG